MTLSICGASPTMESLEVSKTCVVLVQQAWSHIMLCHLGFQFAVVRTHCGPQCGLEQLRMVSMSDAMYTWCGLTCA